MTYKSKIRHLIKTGKTHNKNVSSAWRYYIFSKNGISMDLNVLTIEQFDLLPIIIDEVAKEEERQMKFAKARGKRR